MGGQLLVRQMGRWGDGGMGREARQEMKTTDSRPPPATDWRLHLALLFVQVTFGAFHVFGKGLLNELPPLAIVASRSLISAPLLLVLALRVDRSIPPPRDLFRFAVLGFLGIFANQLLYIYGLQMTSAINAAIIMPSIPVFVALLAWATRAEPMTRLKALGVGLAVARSGRRRRAARGRDPGTASGRPRGHRRRARLGAAPGTGP